MASGVAAVWVPVTDMQRAVEFYGGTLGLQVQSQDDDWSMIDAGGLLIGLNGRERAGGSSDGGAVISFQPDGDIAAEVERLHGAGIEFPGGISDHEWGRIAAFRDPDGNALQFYAPPQ